MSELEAKDLAVRLLLKLRSKEAAKLVARSCLDEDEADILLEWIDKYPEDLL